MSNKLQFPLPPPPLPEKLADWKRETKAVRTINDLVEDVHKSLAENKKYLRFLYAVHDSQAVEGSLSADNYCAAGMIRDKAKAIDPDGEVAQSNLATINLALTVVLRRYHQSRKQRKNMIAGERVPDDNGDE